MFVVSPSIVQTIINFSSILVSSDRLRVAAPSLLIIWFANDRRLVVSVLLLFIFLVIVVVKPSSAGIDRRVRSDPRGLLGADGLRAGARDRGGVLREGREPRQLARRAILDRAEMERRLGSGRSAQYTARDRHLSARRVRRPAAERPKPAPSRKDLMADRCRRRDDRVRSTLGAAVPDRQEHLDV